MREAVERGASDVHLTAGSPPALRMDGEIHQLALEPLTGKLLKELIYSMMSETQIRGFELDRELDFSYSIKNLGRFRVNVFQQRGSVASVIRTVPTTKLSIEQLGLPAVTKDIIMRPRGLILVTGPTGSGKSTSLAAMIDYINENRKGHIITIEDPIEFLHDHKGCLVNQREVGGDTLSFANALKRVLRQDPDVILVGELRDTESMSTAITAAETGHLVFATLHTNDSAQSIDRIIDVFPMHQQAQIRLQLSNSLQAVFCQTLVRRIGGGRCMAYELLIANNAVRNLIREGKIHQIPTVIETNVAMGMRNLETSLIDLVKKHVASKEDAREHASNPAEFDKAFTGS
ncbi:MAG: type IV pilus twitching motility protein PilT [bacterium]|nr:type IV pilus twitching motility protein PilT [bacterium]